MIVLICENSVSYFGTVHKILHLVSVRAHIPKRSGKDISNIDGIPLNIGEGKDGRPAPVGKKQKRKGRSLNTLDSDEGDDSDEYQLSG